MTANQRRTKVEVTPGSAPSGRVHALLLTRDGLARILGEGSPDVSDAERGRIRALVSATRFVARDGQVLAVSDGAAGCLWLVGRGKTGTLSMRRAAARATRLIPDDMEWSLRLGLAATDEENHRALVRAAVEGLELGAYRYRIGGTGSGESGAGDERAPAPGPCRLVLPPGIGDGDALVRRALAVCEGVLLARDLINEPAAQLGPDELAGAAEDVARSHGMEVTVYRGDAVAERGFRMVEAVGRGSARKSTVTVVRVGDPTATPALALVGKGVVFDTGGLNIKRGENMLLMRKDMGGAGTVIGSLDAIGRLGTSVPLLAVLPAAENAIGPESFRPGDILRSYSGLTVQIGNTDAEGRLLLGDALAFAREQGARRILDLATLTGSARQALGPDVPALFGTDEELVASLLEHSSANDEPAWRLPLIDDYNKQLNTPHADMVNIASDPRGGAITAALFLRRFVEPTPWAHVDLYAWEDKGRPETPKGANGMMVRTLADVVAALATD